MFENDSGLVIECAVAIVAQIPLKYSIAAVFGHRFSSEARVTDAVMSANPCQQFCGLTL